MNYRQAKQAAKANPGVTYTWESETHDHRGYWCSWRNRFIAECRSKSEAHGVAVWF